jgi:hypothetical protein
MVKTPEGIVKNILGDRRSRNMEDDKKKIKYGFMVSELTGEVDNLQTTGDKPSHESAGFSYAKWFDSPEQRDKVKKYTEEQIKKRQR